MTLGERLSSLNQSLESTPPPRLRRWLRWALFAVLLGLISHGHYAGSGDAVHYMMIARSLVFDRDLDVGNEYADRGNLVYEGRLEAGAHARPGRGGVLRPVHDVGLPLVAAPYFAAAYWLAEGITDSLPARLRARARLSKWIVLRQLMSVAMIGLSVWLAGLFFDAALELTGRPVAAWLWAGLWSSSPPILSLAYVFFPEILGALVALTLYNARPRVAQASSWRCLALGLGAGLLVLLHARYAALALVLCVLIGARLRGDRHRLAVFGLGCALAVGVRTALNLHLWGTLVTSPHATLGVWTGALHEAEEALRRAAGLCFDQEHGLLPSAPVYALAPAGFVLLWRRAPWLAAELAALLGVYALSILLPFTNVHGWRGGWSPAARFLVPVAPFLGLPIALLFLRRNSRALVVGLAAVQLLLDGFFWSRPMLLWSEEAGAAPFLLALGGPALAEAFPSLLRLSAYDLTLCAGLAALVALLTGLLSAGSLSEAARPPGAQ